MLGWRPAMRGLRMVACAQRAGFRSITLRTSPAARSDWSLSADRRDVSHHSTRARTRLAARGHAKRRQNVASHSSRRGRLKPASGRFHAWCAQLVGGWRHGRKSAHRCGHTKADAAQPKGRATRGFTICRRSAKASDTTGTDQGCTRLRDAAWQRAQHRRTCAQQRRPAAAPWRGQWQGCCVHGPEGPQQHGPRCVLVGFLIPATWAHAAGIKQARAREPVCPPSAQGRSSSAAGHWDSNFCVERHHAGGRDRAACWCRCSQALSPVELDIPLSCLAGASWEYGDISALAAHHIRPVGMPRACRTWRGERHGTSPQNLRGRTASCGVSVSQAALFRNRQPGSVWLD